MKELDGGGGFSPESQIHPAVVAAGQILTIQKATQRPATTLATIAAKAMTRYRMPGRGLAIGFIPLPMVMPGIIRAAGLLVFAIAGGMPERPQILVWDLLVRIGHWPLVPFIFVANFTEPNWHSGNWRIPRCRGPWDLSTASSVGKRRYLIPRSADNDP